MFNNPADLPRSSNEEERKVIIETASKQKSALNNPCVREQELSYKCLSDNHYNREKCMAAFANYSNCQKFWKRVQAERRVQGIRPHLPRPEDRDQIKREFMNKVDAGGGSSGDKT